jgi:hypothetical protein
VTDTEHGRLMSVIHGEIATLTDVSEISPTDVAWRVYQAIGSGAEPNPLVRYACLEHIKAMSRRALARRFTADGDDNPAHQGELFSGALQDRYPLPKGAGVEPVYKLRCDLSPHERAWNVDQLRKSARARLEHADALEGEGRHFGLAA